MAEAKILIGDMLKALLPYSLIDRGEFLDIDATYKAGIYISPAEKGTGTYPASSVVWKYGGLIVIEARGRRIVQILFSDACDMAVRMSLSDHSAWMPWRIVTTTQA